MAHIHYSIPPTGLQKKLDTRPEQEKTLNSAL